MRNMLMWKTIIFKPCVAVFFSLLCAGSVYADEPLDKDLKDAIAEGVLVKVKAQLFTGTAGATGRKINLPKLESAMELNIDMFNMLMEDGINIYLDEDPDEISAWLASVDKNLAIFTLLAKNMPPAVVRSNHYYFEIFRQAIFEGHIEVIKKILDFKFDVNMQDGEGVTPLILAVKEGNYEIVTLLLMNGSDVNHKSIYETALINAVSQGYKNIIKHLLDNNADVNAQVHGGEAALWTLIRKTDRVLFDLLIDYGADINIKTRFGNTMLMEAVRLDNIKIVRLLIEKGAEINAVDAIGETSLMKAAEAGQTPALRLLLELGADFNKRSKTGETALMKAVSKWRNDDILRLLLDMGADASVVSDLGQTASTRAADMGNTGYIEILSAAGVE